MSKVSKIVLLVVTGIVAAFFLLSISVNLYLQSQGVQQRISQAVSDAIGTCVTIQRTSYVPWRGIVLGKITISNIKCGDEGYPILLTIGNVRLRISWIPFLLQRKLALSSIRLEDPVLTLGEPGASAEMLASPIHPPPVKSNSTSAVRQRSTRSAIPAASPIEHTTSKPNPIDKRPPPPDSFPPDLPRIFVSNGKFHFLTKEGKVRVTAEKIAMQLASTTDGHLAGPLTCNRVSFYGMLFLRDIQASLSCLPNTLDASPISGSLAGGKVQGEFHFRRSKQSIFRLQLNGEEISLEALLKQAGYRTAGSSGFLRGNIYFSNEGEEPGGRGAVELLQGRLESTDFLRQLGRLLQVQELETLHLKKAAVSSFEIRKDRLVFDNIFLESENLILKGTGPIQFDGKLNIAAQLLFNDRLYAQYQSLLGKSLPISSIQGYHEVAFHVTGQTSSPRSDLLDKLTGIRIRGNVGGFLQQLMGWPKSKQSD